MRFFALHMGMKKDSILFVTLTAVKNSFDTIRIMRQITGWNWTILIMRNFLRSYFGENLANFLKSRTTICRILSFMTENG